MSVYDNTLSARTYISYIAEQAGGNAIIGRDGKLYIKTFGEPVAEIPIKKMKNFAWGEKFTLSRIRYEDGIRVFEKGDTTGNTIYISSDNMYIVSQEQIDNIYEQLKGLELYSFKGEGIVDPALDAGDIVLIDGKKVLYQGSSEYKGKFYANISSEIKSKSVEETTVRTPSQKTINRRIQSQIDQENLRITQVIEQTEENSQKITETEQTLEGITQTVESMEEFAREVSSVNQLHLTETAELENLVLTFKAYGDTNKWISLAPSSSLAPSVSLAPFGSSITIICDTQPRDNPSLNKKEHKIMIDKKLRNLGDIRDELNIINNKVSIIRRIGVDENGEQYILDNEIIEELEEVVLETFKNDTYIYIKEYCNLKYFCRYITDNEYIKKFATQDDLQSATVVLNTKIEQTSKSILLLASEKVGKNEVIASINISPEKIKILAKLLELEGYTTINGGFKIDEHGNMEAVNGKFTGGTIDLFSADINNPILGVAENNTYTGFYTLIYPKGININGDNGYVLLYSENTQILVSNNDETNQSRIRPHQIQTTGQMYATSFNNSSKLEIKENIEKFNMDALRLIKNTGIYSFNYKNNKNSKTIGLIIGKGYNTPKEVISNNEAIDLYSMNSLSWKAIQELDKKIEKIVSILKKIPILGKIIAKRWKK